MTKTKEELSQLKQEYESLNNKIKELSDGELEKVAAGNDIDSLRVSGKEVPLPEAKSKKESDGGYSGKIISEASGDKE